VAGGTPTPRELPGGTPFDRLDQQPKDGQTSFLRQRQRSGGFEIHISILIEM
jgi:hypothetical protein